MLSKNNILHNDVQVLITGGMGTSLVHRLKNMGIKLLITLETNSDKVVGDKMEVSCDD